MRGRLADFVGLLFFGLVVVVLVRNRTGTQAVQAIGSALTSLVQTAIAP